MAVHFVVGVANVIVTVGTLVMASWMVPICTGQMEMFRMEGVALKTEIVCRVPVTPRMCSPMVLMREFKTTCAVHHHLPPNQQAFQHLFLRLGQLPSLLDPLDDIKRLAPMMLAVSIVSDCSYICEPTLSLESSPLAHNFLLIVSSYQ